MNLMEKQNKGSLYIVASRAVAAILRPEEIQEALQKLEVKMQKQDPLNPDLWTVFIGKYKLWGILDHRAGPNGEDLLTILFPEDY
jgi:hypothetical protein